MNNQEIKKDSQKKVDYAHDKNKMRLTCKEGQFVVFIENLELQIGNAIYYLSNNGNDLSIVKLQDEIESSFIF